MGFIGYLTAALAFSLLAILLLISWRGALKGGLLTVAAAASAVWAGFAAYVAYYDSFAVPAYEMFEVLRYLAWFVFLLKLLESATMQNVRYQGFVRKALYSTVLFALLVLAQGLFQPRVEWLVSSDNLVMLKIIMHLFLPIFGLVIIEQLFRVTDKRFRWAIKYLFIGVGGIFVYDILLFSNAMLFGGLNRELWEARGFINLIAVPLLAISVARNREWSLEMFVSRDVVYHSTAIAASGLYLIVMAAGGYYIQEYGGSWGGLVQTIFLALAVLVLLVVLFSAQLQAQLRVFLGKHFFKNKYDYRHEWLRLTAGLTNQDNDTNKLEIAVKVIAKIVDCRSGMLWLQDETGSFRNRAGWQLPQIDEVEGEESSLVLFLKQKGYVINTSEISTKAEEYVDLLLPVWLASVPNAWLIIPLHGQASLMGFIVLANPLVSKVISWEDRDLLKTAACQVSSYLSVLKTSDALAEAKQFEAFNRLSAYMVHDLKNVAAELELIERNAVKHRANEAFVDDVFDTVKNTSKDIRRMLEQFKNKRAVSGKQNVIDLHKLVTDVAEKSHDSEPVPIVENTGNNNFVVAESDRLAVVLRHLIDNAQQATPSDGWVKVAIKNGGDTNIVNIEDSGCGMETKFIHERLFRPFDTTKGNAGMGIGMFESREFIRSLGGDIQVTSQPGDGTCVAVHIPAYQEPAQL